jgi:hypothetical protein
MGTMTNETKPDYVLALERAFGPPSQEGFGSAGFSMHMVEADDLEQVAQHFYQVFVGDKWAKWGAETWMASWQQVYTREPGSKPDIVNELRAIEDRETSLSVPLILDVSEEAEAARKALAGAFDAADGVDIQVYTIGDGDALSGVLLAGKHGKGQVTCLVFLMD